MKAISKILILIAIFVSSLLAADQYYLSFQDKELKKSDWVQNCVPAGPDVIIPSIGLYNHTHSFDLQTCSWDPIEHGSPGFLESLYVSFVEPLFIEVADGLETKYAYASCAAPLLGPPGPCFDSFSVSPDSQLTERSIMEDYARNIELNYPDWQMSERKWDDEGTSLRLPAIICTEFVADGTKQYRMAKWVDLRTISSFENHRNDFLCNKWLAPIDDGVKIKWDKPNYLSDDVGIVQVIDKEMNQDNKNTESFSIRVWSDIDHMGIELTVTETDADSGIFEGNVFFTANDKSGDARLLVEDAVRAEHKSSIGFVRIVDEKPGDVVLGESNVKNFGDTANPNECWYQDDDGNFLPCKMGDDGYGFAVGMFFVIFWPYVIFAVGILVIFVVWRKRK